MNTRPAERAHPTGATGSGAPPSLADSSPDPHSGVRALTLRARVEAAGVQVSALDPGRVRISCDAAALDAREHAVLRELGLLGAPALPPAGERARLAVEGPVAALEEAVAREPGLLPLLAAHRSGTAPPAPPRVMGIVNVTPDSFSDGGRFLAPERAVEHGLALAAEGASVLDVGGESTRPGSAGVSLEEELARVLPVVEGLVARTAVPVSIDTTKAAVARAALEAGAVMVNDVSAGRNDPALLEVVAGHGAQLVLMHMRGTPRTMQDDPRYDDVVDAVVEHLRERLAAAWRAGVAVHRILLDPGIGFGKRLEDNLALIRALPALRSLGRPVVLGVSRKSFLGRLGGVERAEERLTDTAAAAAAGVLLGAEVLRLHAVADLLPALRVAAALAPAGGAPEGRVP